MRIVFNDSFAADPNLFKTQTNERSVFVSSNLILEKKIILAAPLPPAQIDNFVLKYKKLSDPDKQKMLKDILTKHAPYDTWEDVDGKQLEVETIDTEKVYKKETEVSTAGYANDSLSYATAFDIAQTQAQLRGDELSIEEFAEQVSNNANLVQNLLRQQKSLDENSSTSGDSRRGKAFVAEASDNPVNGTSVKQVNMTNYNRDRVLAGAETNFLDAPDDDGIADTIDLETEIDLESEKGSIRRV